MTAMRSASARISSRSSLISSTPTPSRGRVAQVRVHGLDRADVEPARRRGGDEHARLARELAREHDLLQVAARQLPRRRVGPGRRARRSARSARARARGSRRRRSSGPARHRRAAVRLEHDVRGDAEARRDAGAEPVLGHVGDAGRDRGARVAAAKRVARRPRPSRPSRRACPVIASASSRCPLPATPATPTISPARTRQRDVAQRVDSPRSPAAAEPVDLERRPRRSRARALGARVERRPRARPSARRATAASRRRSATVATTRPRAQHGDAVGDRLHLVRACAR